MMSAATEMPNAMPQMASPVLAANPQREPVGISAMLTFVLWVGCLTIGAGGFLLSYARPIPPAPVPPPVTAQLLQVELTSEPLPPPDATPPPLNSLAPPPPMAEPPPALPPAPPMMAVAAPSPHIAFAVPIEAPAQVVPAREASYRTVETPVVAPPTPAPPAPRQLVFGTGDAKLPAPEYPRQAEREGQEGTVLLRLTLGPDRTIVSAEAVAPSPWPLLNQSALRAARSSWRHRLRHLPPGVYDIPIHFQLRK